MDVTTVILTVIMMGLILFIGALVALKNTITYEAKQLFMSVIINVAVPFIILNGVFNTDLTDDVLHQVILMFICSVSFNVLAVGICFLFGKIIGFSMTKSKQLALLAAIGNSGFIGIPLCAAIFGPTGGLLAAIFDAGLDVVVFSLGIYLLQNNNHFEWRHLKALVNMPLIAISFGLIFAFNGWGAPVLFKDLASMLSALAAPMAMLYVGFSLPDLFRSKQPLFFRELWMPLVWKLLILPIMVMIILSFLPLETLLKNILVILACMPTFMLSAVLFSRYTDKEQEAVVTSVFSTILALGTIPFIAWLSAFWIG
ncbi:MULTISPECIES: AEC family transporter [Oceanobacillus]|uniref:Membrane transport protein n=2 Tax=Oceanobacillus TaxID=182709 RepID=A0A0A1MTA5_9BACI|nr:AEC family transporter [Oceanobacillus oncorhynchi]MDM8101130.1 AEC family transporter [Oceanobacillus oncorhynchi]CEI82201.1 Membrane transport protein [Oceanobacillus oncorhynchi]